jgi:hypothetical protein
MSYIKADNPKEQKHFDYLEELRQSGDTNMFGAAPYLRAEFPRDFSPKRGFHDDEAGAVLAKWMKLHDDPSRIRDIPS